MGVNEEGVRSGAWGRMPVFRVAAIRTADSHGGVEGLNLEV